MYRTDFWTLGEGEGGIFQENSIETCILSRVKQITSPGWMHETSARTWYLLQYSCLENSNGQRSLVGYSSWGRKKPDMTEVT